LGNLARTIIKTNISQFCKRKLEEHFECILGYIHQGSELKWDNHYDNAEKQFGWTFVTRMERISKWEGCIYFLNIGKWNDQKSSGEFQQDGQKNGRKSLSEKRKLRQNGIWRQNKHIENGKIKQYIFHSGEVINHCKIRKRIKWKKMNGTLLLKKKYFLESSLKNMFNFLHTYICTF